MKRGDKKYIGNILNFSTEYLSKTSDKNMDIVY
jgi:hypothetical protein